jgi:hypothetical protein
MPTFEPPKRPDEVCVEKLDIIGYRERKHLSHVGFAWAFAEVSRDNEIAVVDARPIRREHDKLPVHVIGRVALNRRERMLMLSWLERYLRSRLLTGDHVHADELVRDGRSSRVIARRTSGPMLVQQCLRSCTNIVLVDLGDLPMVERSRLIDLWGEKALQMSTFREELSDEGPWALLLPAHIFHALARGESRSPALRVTAGQWDY